jgi:hypothetical protein
LPPVGKDRDITPKPFPISFVTFVAFWESRNDRFTLRVFGTGFDDPA